MYKFIYIILFILSSLVIYNIFDIKKKIIFLSQKDREIIYNILVKSDYFKRFNKVDFIVRKCNNINSCITNYCDNIKDFTKEQKDYLSQLCDMVNNKIKKYSKLSKLNWKFCKFNINIENGYPHTHSDIIFISDKFFKFNINENMITLLHELIHIYQRLYPNETRLFHDKIGLKYSKCICNYNMYHRSSPDDSSKDHYIFKGYLVRSQYLTGATNLSQMNIIFNKIRDYDTNNDYSGEKILKELRLKYGIQIESENEVTASMISLFIINNIKFDNYLNNFDIEVYKYLS